MFTTIQPFSSSVFQQGKKKKAFMFLLGSPLEEWNEAVQLFSKDEESSEKDEESLDVEFSFEWVTDIVTRVTADQLEIDPSEISLEKRFIKDLKADSLDIMEINMELEKELKIEVPDYCIGFIVTVEDAVVIIYRLLNGMELPHAKPE